MNFDFPGRWQRLMDDLAIMGLAWLLGFMGGLYAAHRGLDCPDLLVRTFDSMLRPFGW